MPSYKICPNCGTTNVDRDYCEQCGALLNSVLQRKLEHEVKRAKERRESLNAAPNAITTAFRKAKKHPNFLVRLIANAFYSVWILVLVVGGLLALVFAYTAA